MNASYHEDEEAENQPSQFTKYNFFILFINYRC